MNKLVRRIKTGEEFPIDISVEDARHCLSNKPFMQLDSELVNETWVQLDQLLQMIALIASTESICEGDWDGEGWYRTVLEKDGDENWLKLVKGCPKTSRKAIRSTAIREFGELG